MRGATHPLPQYALKAWCSVKSNHRDNFTFCLWSDGNMKWYNGENLIMNLGTKLIWTGGKCRGLCKVTFLERLGTTMKHISLLPANRTYFGLRHNSHWSLRFNCCLLHGHVRECAFCMVVHRTEVSEFCHLNSFHRQNSYETGKRESYSKFVASREKTFWGS
jgi:hypothetical protein